MIDRDKYLKGKNNLLDEDTIFNVSNLYKVFSDETRLKILTILLDNELCVYDIAEILDMTHSSISHQLKVLRDMKLVKAHKHGKNVYYTLIDDHIERIIKIGVEHVNEK